MSIIVYCGVPGSGKSYEVVRSVVIPAIKAGRRVVSNIDGLDIEKIRDYCVAKFSCDRDSLGCLLKVGQKEISSPAFFPLVEDGHLVPGDYVVKPGDLVCVDEGYKFWGSGKLHDTHLTFFREHRHFADSESGLTCDLVIMTQGYRDLHRMLISVVEQNYLTHKAKAIRDNLYTITQYEGNKQTKSSIVRDWTGTYDPEIFPLYKSYFGGKGKEGSVDARQKFLSGGVLKKVLFVAFAVVFILYRFGHFLYQKVYVDPVQAESSKHVDSSVAAAPGAVGVSVPAGQRASVVSSDWRLSGSMMVRGRRLLVLVNSSGRMRLESPEGFSGEDGLEFGLVDGARVGRFSGSLPSSSGGVKP